MVLPSLPTSQQPGSFMNSQYSVHNNASSLQHTGVSLNPGIPAHFQNYRPIEHGQPIVPSQPHAHVFTPQNSYPNPAMQTQGGPVQYSDPTTGPSSPSMSGSPTPASSTSSPAYVCDVCRAVFTRPQNLKRHYESQHTSMEHVCPYCRKNYARVDSLKRHMDKHCDKMPQSSRDGE
jgi:hypothetical protein